MRWGQIIFSIKGGISLKERERKFYEKRDVNAKSSGKKLQKEWV